MRAPAGAWAVSSLRLTPERVSEPAIRTIGNGCISTSGTELTGMVSVAMLVEPLAALTRSRTTWLPGVVNDVVSRDFPVWNTPVPARDQANPVIGLAMSVELDTRETFSPVLGAAGNHVNDAAGGGTGGGARTVNVTGALTPRLPTSSDCCARAV